jgi:rare lipoprotein A
MISRVPTRNKDATAHAKNEGGLSRDTLPGKRVSLAISILVLAFLAFPLAAQSELIKLEALASYYGDEFQGRPTSSGEIFDMNGYTCAHKNLPFGTMLEVTNLENGRKTVVRVNDRGPFVAGRELDVSKAAAYDLGMVATGTARVSIRKIGMDSASAAARPAGGAALGSAPTATAGTAAVAAASPAQPDAPPASAATAPGTADATPAKTAVSAGTAPSGEPRWRIQLGSFSKPENADRFVVQLRKDGFNPAIERNGTMTRVVLAGIPDSALGPMKDRLAAAGYGNCLVRGE